MRAALAGELAELVCNLRVRAGLTQAELARRMGTTQSSIARIESGGRLPTVEMLARLTRRWGSRCGWRPLAWMPSGWAALDPVPDLSAPAGSRARSLSVNGPWLDTGTVLKYIRRWPANGRANGTCAKRADLGIADATPGTSAQADEQGRRSVVLIIRRSWVRSPPAPPGLTWAFALEAGADLGFANNLAMG